MQTVTIRRGGAAPEVTHAAIDATAHVVLGCRISRPELREDSFTSDRDSHWQSRGFASFLVARERQLALCLVDPG